MNVLLLPLPQSMRPIAALHVPTEHHRNGWILFCFLSLLHSPQRLSLRPLYFFPWISRRVESAGRADPRLERTAVSFSVGNPANTAPARWSYSSPIKSFFASARAPKRWPT